MLLTKKELVLKGSNSRSMGVDVVLNSRELSNKPVVIFCHGYKGFKDWGCWNLVAEEFANQGFNFIKFNFSHNGVTADSPLDFVDLEAFGNNNYTKELFDLSVIIDWVESDNEFQDLFDSNQIYLIGHSRGGGIVSLATVNDSRIKKTITWASVFNLTERLPKNIEDWRDSGVCYQLNGRTNQNMPLFYQFYENTELNKDELNIEKTGKKISTPFCVIHGSADTVVDVEEAEKLSNTISNSQLIILENAGHTFGSSHPYSENQLPKDLENVVKESCYFLQ